MGSTFEEMLAGGHPNSLGRTEEVADIIIANKDKLIDLWDCYESEDEVVRLRVSSALKRVAKANPALVYTLFDDFVALARTLKQPSFQWSFAQIMLWIDKELDDKEREQVIKTLKQNLQESDDWIVLNMTMETLTAHAKNDQGLAKWLLPYLTTLAKDSRKSVASRAKKYKVELYE